VGELNEGERAKWKFNNAEALGRAVHQDKRQQERQDEKIASE
jgi:hypothetical protein